MRCRFDKNESDAHGCRYAALDMGVIYCGFKTGIMPGGTKTIDTRKMIGCPRDPENLKMPKTIKDAICNDCGRVFQFRGAFNKVERCIHCLGKNIEEKYGISNN